jgi:hypothetical protein
MRLPSGLFPLLLAAIGLAVSSHARVQFPRHGSGNVLYRITEECWPPTFDRRKLETETPFGLMPTGPKRNQVIANWIESDFNCEGDDLVTKGVYVWVKEGQRWALRKGCWKHHGTLRLPDQLIIQDDQ